MLWESISSRKQRLNQMSEVNIIFLKNTSGRLTMPTMLIFVWRLPVSTGGSSYSWVVLARMGLLASWRIFLCYSGNSLHAGKQWNFWCMTSRNTFIVQDVKSPPLDACIGFDFLHHLSQNWPLIRNPQVTTREMFKHFFNKLFKLMFVLDKD